MFQEATGRHAQQGLLNDVMLPFSASPLVGLWYVKLQPCGACGPNLNTALGSSTIAWLGEAGMVLAYSTGCHMHSILLDRMGLGCRGREDLVMQNHSTSSIIKHLQIPFPTEEHQITKNPVRYAGEVDPQNGTWHLSVVVVLTWTILPDKVCSQLPLPQFLVGVAAGLSRVQGLELSEDKGNCCSIGIGVKGGLKCLLFFFFNFSASELHVYNVNGEHQHN